MNQLSIDDVKYDLNNEVPRLWIKGNEVGIVSMTKHYVTRDIKLGTNTTTFVYVTKDSPENKTLSITHINGGVFHQ
ncbi:MAG: hypothetical protein RR968_00105 [Vagococcus sp.]